MGKETFLVLNLVLAFYNVGTIWAHEIDIFRTWKLIDRVSFHKVQEAHWKKLPFWVFIPVGLALIGSIILFWYHPDKANLWEIWLVFLFQFISLGLTAILWGQWQARLANDELGSESPYLKKILRTHWVRTILINAYAFMLLIIMIQTL